MPQRTFSALDVVDFSINTIVPDDHSTLPWVRSGTGFNNFLAQVSGSSTDPNPITFIPYGYCQNELWVYLTGLFDFQIFPAVPITAIINNVKLRYAASINCQAQDNNSQAGIDAGAACYTVSIQDQRTSYKYNDLIAADSFVNDPDNAFAATNASYNLATSEAEHDFPAGLSYDDFVSFFQSIYFHVQATLNAASTNSDGNSTSGIIEITNLELIVTYDGPVTSYTIEPTEAHKGEKITITNLGGGMEESILGGMGNVESIAMTIDGETKIIPKIDFWWQSPTEIIFYNPINKTGTVTIVLIGPKLGGSGTEFSGSVTAGTLEVLFEDVSGIYRIIKGKPTDTIYNPDRTGETINVKIPDPFAALGFIDG